MLIDLLKHKPDSISYILGVTSKDISTTKRNSDGTTKTPESKYSDWGIFGLGYRPGQSCVVSTFRIKHAEHDVFVSRMEKISIHEIGHNMGLKHCETENCVMQDAVETIKTVDNVSNQLCTNCIDQL